MRLLGIFLRLPPIVVLAGATAFGLMYLMQVLIATGGVGTTTAEVFKISDPVMPPENIERPLDIEIPQYEDLAEPPPAVPDTPPETDPGDLVNLPVTRQPPQKPSLDYGGAGRMDNTEMIPIVRSPPSYPTRAATRGIQGYVLLEFTVDETGRVVNPKVLEYEPSSIFNSAALRAIKKWRYRPRVVDGVAIPVDGQQFKMIFELEGVQ